MLKTLWPPALLLPLLAAPLLCAQAQTPPDAGSLQRQIEQERKPALPRPVTPDKPAVPAAAPSLAGALTTVKSFRFEGNTRLTAEQLAPVVASYLNRPLDLVQLQEAVAAVAETYREAGWVVRAYLPGQDITSGVVTVRIVEAVFGQVHREGPDSLRVKPAVLQDFLSAQLKTGELLNSAALDRALLLADDLPGVTVAGSLKPGARERETDLVLQLGDEPLVAGGATLDNMGARSTGPNRLGVNASLSSPLRLGDLFSAYLIHTQGVDSARLGASLPLGADGWRVGLNASHFSYRLVGADFSALDAKGTSDTAGLEATYPILRSRQQNLYLAVNLDHKAFHNLSGGAVVTHYQADSATLALNGNQFDNLGGGGASTGNLALVWGHLDLANSPNRSADAATTQTAGQFSVLRYALSRQQTLSNIVSAQAALSGQWAAKNLDSSEKFYLGGVSGVRAYPNNEGGGALGHLMNLELRGRLTDRASLAGFYDRGCVTQNRDNGFAGAPALNHYCLQGAGLSFVWQAGNGPSLSAIWARRLGHNPNPTATGNDQDGSLTRNRFWLTASQRF